MAAGKSTTTKLLTLPKRLKEQVDAAAWRKKTKATQFIREAIVEKLQREFSPNQLKKLK